MSRERALAIKAMLREVVDRQVAAFGPLTADIGGEKYPITGTEGLDRLLNHIVGNASMVIDMALDAGDIKGDDKTSDGYHTFKELYDHRITLFVALCAEVCHYQSGGADVWRSKLHSDGTMFDGWFVAGIGTEPGKQITYHLPLERWADLDHIGRTLERAPTFDGHTSADVLDRIRRLRG